MSRSSPNLTPASMPLPPPPALRGNPTWRGGGPESHAWDAHARSTGRSLRYQPHIDGLRAIAVTGVVLYHAFPKLLPGGFVGVDVFFVISGYLITGLILAARQQGTFSLREFYARRVRRIVPALVLVLILVGAFGWLALLPGELTLLGNATAWCAAFVANRFFGTAFGGYFDNDSALNPLLHLWSLGVEEQFYLLWPLLLMLATRSRLLMPAIAAVIAGSLAFSLWGAWHEPAPYFYMLSARMWELALGGALAALGTAQGLRASSTAQPRPTRRADVAVVLGLAAIIGAALWLDSSLAFPGAWGLIPCAGSVLLISAGGRSWIGQRLLAAPAAVWLGKISYPLYLWHWPLLSLTRVVLGHPPSPEVRIALIAVALVAAYLTYRFLERPVRRGVAGPWAVPALLAGLSGIAVLGLATGHHWVKGRMSGPAFAAIEAAGFDWSYPGDSNYGRSGTFRTFAASSRRREKALFIGDSHIEHYWARATRVVELHPDTARSAVFATYIGCPPLPAVNSVRHPWSNCPSFLDFALQQAARADVDTVAVGAFWEIYLPGEFSLDHSSQIIYRVGDPLRRRLTLDSEGTRVALAQFQEMLARLVANGKRVFVILSNPTSPDFSPIALLPASVRLGLRTLPDTASVAPRFVDSRQFEAFVAPLMERLRAAAAAAGAVVIDPRESLCAQMSCPAQANDGRALYMDSNHLRPFFARERAVFIDPILLDDTAQDAAEH